MPKMEQQDNKKNNKQIRLILILKSNIQRPTSFNITKAVKPKPIKINNTNIDKNREYIINIQHRYLQHNIK